MRKSKRKIKEFDTVIEYSPIPYCRGKGWVEGGTGWEVLDSRFFENFLLLLLPPPLRSIEGDWVRKEVNHVKLVNHINVTEAVP